MHTVPFSLLFFVATGIVFGLQAVPIVSIIFILMLAMFWSVLLVNAGMIGIVIEVWMGRVARLWLIVPVAFYGYYYSSVISDYATLRKLGNDYEIANSKVEIPFNPNRHALVFNGEDDYGSWYTQNYALPVAFSRNTNYPEGYRSSRLMPSDLCATVREYSALKAAQIYTFGVSDGDDIGSRKFETRFCNLNMPERPRLPIVSVVRKEQAGFEGALPFTRSTTTVTMPDGKIFTLFGGVAGPLSWLPMPIVGCGFDTGGPDWNCGAGFWRNGFTPIVSGNTRYRRDEVVLADALGLKRVELGDRRGGDQTLVLARMAEVEGATLKRQLAQIDKMVADPLADADWQVGVVESTGSALLARAEPIMSGIERAATYQTPLEHAKARNNGRVLAKLLANLPRDRFVAFGPRILALYRDNVDPPPTLNSKASSRIESHWLWESEELLRRIGDLGPDALFVATDRRALAPSVNSAGIEAICRIGAAGKGAAPVLLDMWEKHDGSDRDEQRALFVAMRRIGINPPPIPESKDERQRRAPTNGLFGGLVKRPLSPMDMLLKDWGDITPNSLARVCSPDEFQARREEKRGMKRRTNLI